MTNFKKGRARRIIYRSSIEDLPTSWTFIEGLAGDSRTCVITVIFTPFVFHLGHLLISTLYFDRHFYRPLPQPFSHPLP